MEWGLMGAVFFTLLLAYRFIRFGPTSSPDHMSPDVWLSVYNLKDSCLVSLKGERYLQTTEHSSECVPQCHTWNKMSIQSYAFEKYWCDQ